MKTNIYQLYYIYIEIWFVNLRFTHIENIFSKNITMKYLLKDENKTQEEGSFG